MAGEVVEKLNHQVELGETLGQVFFVILILLEVAVQSLDQSQEWVAELVENMVDLNVKLVGLEERSPALEDGVRNLEDTNVDGRVGWR